MYISTKSLGTFVVINEYILLMNLKPYKWLSDNYQCLSIQHILRLCNCAYLRPLNSHDLVVRHTISALVSRLFVHLTISQDLTEILLICAKMSIYCVT